MSVERSESPRSVKATPPMDETPQVLGPIDVENLPTYRARPNKMFNFKGSGNNFFAKFAFNKSQSYEKKQLE